MKGVVITGGAQGIGKNTTIGLLKAGYVREINVILFFIFFSVFLRFFSLFPSVIDHDESTYLVIGNEITKGAVLYKDFTDIKPVGIFYIAAGVIELFGRSIFAFRLFGCVIIALTSFFLYKIKLKIGYTRKVALAAGLMYIFFLSTWIFYGVSLNTEHFFNFFTALAVLVFFQYADRMRIYLIAFIMGLGFLIKIMVAFDMLAIFLFMLIMDIKNEQVSVKGLLKYVIAGVVFLLPFGIINLSYYLTGNFEDFAHINYSTFLNYSSDSKNFGKLVGWIVVFFLRFFPISYVYFYVLFKKENDVGSKRNEKLFVLLWFCFDLISILLPGKVSAHYLIQLMLPMSLLSSAIFSERTVKPAYLQKIFSGKVGIPLLLFFVLIIQLLMSRDLSVKKDYAPKLTAKLQQYINKDELIYTGNCQHIIYFLLDKSPPTRYVHKTILYSKGHQRALNINARNELDTIFNKEPLYILNDRFGMKNRYLDSIVNMDYSIIDSLTDFNVYIYKRKNPL